MDKQNKPKKRAGAIILVILLAILCIGGVELAASYFFAPAWFEKTTAPVRNGIRAVAEFCVETGQEAADFLQELSISWKARQEARELPETQELADEPLVDSPAVFVDPSITELRLENGQSVLTGGIVEVDYFNQTEEPWASQPYGSDNIGRYGCGPTAMAMVVSSMTDVETDPAQMAQWAVNNHHWARKNGSYHSIVQASAQAHGLTAAACELTADAIQDTLLSGKMLIALMGPGHFTKSGHFIVLRGITLSGTILVADPASTERSLMEWDAQLIVDELSRSRNSGSPLWAIGTT